jgi:RNA polymerase sigma factor (TIGR02999 family)
MSSVIPPRADEPDSAGLPQAVEDLLPLVYAELRTLAAHKMANEMATQTLQPTALVHEAWLRLAGQKNPHFANRAHFFSAAAEAMRRILIERARRRRALRHGGGQQRAELEDLPVPAPAEDDQLLSVNDALDKLAARKPLEAEVVKLRYFVGLTNEQVAEALGISERTVKNYWAHARAWLFEEITRQAAG